MRRSARKKIRAAVSLSVDSWLLEEAKRLNLDLSAAARAGIAKAVAEEKSRRWRIENRELIRRLDDAVEATGLRLHPFREF